MRKFGLFTALLALTLLCNSGSRAESVSLSYEGLTLDGVLETADGKALEDGVVLMVHGTTAHNRMEIMVAMGELLKERGISSLAITLSLGVDNRRGPVDCSMQHRHRHFDAIGEIKAWMDWLKGKGVKRIALFGHSRGGNQVAMVAAEHDNPLIDKVVLAAPQVWSLDSESEDYKKRYGVALQPIMGKALAAVMGKRGDTVMTDTDFLYCPKANVTARSFTGYYINNPKLDTPHIVEWIDKPVLVVAAGNDAVNQLLPKKMEAITKESVRFEVVEDADHMFIDLFADDLADLTADFLAWE